MQDEAQHIIKKLGSEDIGMSSTKRLMRMLKIVQREEKYEMLYDYKMRVYRQCFTDKLMIQIYTSREPDTFPCYEYVV